MLKVIVLSKGLDLSKATFSKTDTCIIIGSEDDVLPVKTVEKLLASKVRIEIVQDKNPASVAFMLGKLSEKEKISEVLTDIPEIAALFGKSPAQKKTPSKAAGKVSMEDKSHASEQEQPAPVKTKRKTVAAKEHEVQPTPPKDAMNPPVVASKEEEKLKKAPGKKAKGKEKDLKTYSSSQFKDVTKEKVLGILKKYKFDEKYLEPVMKALSMATDISLDLYVRTQVAVMEDDKDICKNIGEAFKKELVG